MTTDSSIPPSVRTARGRAIALTACGVVLAGMLLVVVFFHQPPTAPVSEPLAGPVTELIVPRELSGSGPAERDDLIGELSAETGWIQSVDEQTGEPDQRYRFARLFPNPDGLPEGWFRMEQPEAQIFLSDRRVLYLSGDSALALAPNRALERGTLTGNVRIQLFETTEVRAFETPDTEPLLTVLTDEAEFNQELGRIICPGSVQVDTTSARMAGRGVTVQFNDLDRVVEHLRIDALQHVTLLAAGTGSEAAVPADRPDAAAVEPTPATAVPDAGDASGRTRAPASGREPRRNRRQRSSTEFYVLTLYDNVVVRQLEAESHRTMSGDRLTVIFSPQSEGLEDLALGAPRLPGPARPAAAALARGGLVQPLPVLLARMALADVDAAAPRPGPGETVITCDGGVTMAPLRDPQLAPPSRRDAVLTMTGTPVRLEDEAAAAEASCGELRYRTRGQRIDLHASSETPLVLRSPDLTAAGERFWLSQRRSAGGFLGGGDLIVDAAGESLPGVDGSGVAGPPAPALQVQWSEALELVFEPEPEGRTGPGRLREAVFVGDVAVRSPEVGMDARGMTVGLEGDDPRRVAIGSVATGPAVIRTAGRAGTIRGERLELDLDVDDDGRSTPRLLVASGGVEASDDSQRLWATTLEAAFADAPASTDERAAGSFGAADIERVVATEDVQVLTADGIRAFAERLDVDAVAERGVLTGGGEEVLIVRENVVLERGTRVEFDRRDGTARWPGPGQARMLAQTLNVTQPSRIPRPAVPAEAPAEMWASWTNGMVYDTTFNDGAGAIDLHGDVRAETRRPGEEQSTIEGQHVTVQLVHADADAGGPEPVTIVAIEDTAAPRGRAIGRFIARHSARLERRTWSREAPERKPDVFFVAGDYVEYDDVAGSALVTGEGTLLIRDLPDGPTETAEATGRRSAPFSGQGTTMFLFGAGLELSTAPDVPPQYTVTMTGGVQGSHQAVDGRTAAVTGERFEAVFARAEDAGDPTAEAPGHGMDLRRLSGRGAVYLRTPARRVECDEFDYDLVSGLARLQALPGRLVSTTTADGERLNAESIEWDMVTDTIRVRRTLGSVDR